MARVKPAGLPKDLENFAEVENWKKGKGTGGLTPPRTAGNTSLTPRMKMACFIYLETGSKTEAYKAAYNPSPDAKNTNKRAYELFEHVEVKNFLETLYNKAQEKHGINLELITKQLLEDRELAFSTEDAKAAVAADLALAKLHGLMVDRKRIEMAGSLEHHIRQARERAAASLPDLKPTTYPVQQFEEPIEGEFSSVEDSSDA